MKSHIASITVCIVIAAIVYFIGVGLWALITDVINLWDNADPNYRLLSLSLLVGLIVRGSGK